MSEWLIFALIFFAGGVVGSIPISIMAIARIEVLEQKHLDEDRLKSPAKVSDVIAASIVISIFWIFLWLQLLTPSNWKKA